MLMALKLLPTLLLAEHMYAPVSSLEAFVIVKFNLTLLTFPYSVGTLILSLIDILLLKVPLVLLHTTVSGYPMASHVIVVVFPSLTIVLLNGLTIVMPMYV